MSIYKKVAAVERVFDGLQKEISTFQAQSSLKCLTGCGKCCTKSDLSATILEFLPLAYHLYKTDKAEEMLAKMDEKSESTICHLFNPLVVGAGSGFCGNYKYRGLICRLFGYAASRDKNGQKTLVTCQLIKADQQVQYQATVGAISDGTMAVPMMSDYQSQLMGIDWELGSKFYPVNTAIRKAVEMVLFYYQFRGRRAS